MIEVGSFRDPVLAEMARGLLASEGIDAVLLGAGIASLGLGGIAPVRLMVAARNRLPAERLLAEIPA
jgi:hypothetical protein